MKLLEDLAVFNRITFIEKTHSYLIDGQPINGPSVTKLLKRFKKKFETETVAARVAKRTKTTLEQVLADWELNNLYSTTIGSMLHKYIENYYCNKRIEFEGNFSGLGLYEKNKILQNLPILIKYFQNFYNDNPHLLCIKNELVLGDLNDSNVCGMMDLLAYNTITDKIEILDFKTNKKMELSSPYGNLLYPFDTLSEGELNEYSIQLNTYKYILEKHTDIKIDKLKIVWFNVVNDNYKIFELEDMQDKIKLMFDEFKKSSLFEEQ